MVLDDAWASGVLRVLISGPGDPRTWSIHIDYGGRGFDLTGATLTSRTVRTAPEGLTVDLPIPGGGRVSASGTPSGLRVRPIGVLALSTVHAQQMIPGSDVRAIDDTSSANERAYAPAFGRLDVTDTNGGVGVCTAFRVSQSHWLTAAHCVYRVLSKADAAPRARWRLQPDAYVGRLEGPTLLEAVPVASGLLAPNPTSSSVIQPTDRDYVLLQVAQDPGGQSFALDVRADAKVGTQLELLQQWKGEFPPSPGKAVSAEAACRVRSRIGPDDYSETLNCPFGIQHGCSSEGGASGGALVEASTFRLVGLHYGAGQDSKFNCAVPAAAIAGDLCQRHPDIARKVLRCP